jgi:hypothetical protein
VGLSGCGSGGVKLAADASPREVACADGRMDPCMAPDLGNRECEEKGRIEAAGKVLGTRAWSYTPADTTPGAADAQAALDGTAFGHAEPASAYTYELVPAGENVAIGLRKIGDRVVASMVVRHRSDGWFALNGVDQLCHETNAVPAFSYVEEEPSEDAADLGVVPAVPADDDTDLRKKRKKPSSSLSTRSASNTRSSSTSTRRR